MYLKIKKELLYSGNLWISRYYVNVFKIYQWRSNINYIKN